MAFCQDVSVRSAFAVHFTIFCLLASIALISFLVPCLCLNSDPMLFLKEAESYTVRCQPIACWKGDRKMHKVREEEGTKIQLVTSGGIMPQTGLTAEDKHLQIIYQ